MRIFLIIFGLIGNFCCVNENTQKSTPTSSNALSAPSANSELALPSDSDTSSLNYRIFIQKFAVAEQAGPSLSEKITAIALDFVGTPYKSGTLERKGSEQLVINLAEVDCWTFVEYCVAIAQTSLQTDKADYQLFEQLVQRLRYRGGLVDGYASRIHYFEEWISQQTSNGIFEDMTRSLGGIPYQKEVAFMSKHPELYPKLCDTTVLKSIENAEQVINTRNYFFVPKMALSNKMSFCKNGDIIAFTSSHPDLDCEHEGFAYLNSKTVYLIHASYDYKKVILTENNLFEYAKGKKRQTGIILLRAL